MQVIPSVCVVSLQHDAEALKLYNHVISFRGLDLHTVKIVKAYCGQVT